MKTWEMIKELTEHTNKQFKYQIPCGDYYTATANNWNADRFELQIKRTDVDEVSAGVIIGLDLDWEEVKQPYTFLEAYEDCEKNGTSFQRDTTVETNICRMYKFSGLVMIDNTSSKSTVLNEYKWYKGD